MTTERFDGAAIWSTLPKEWQNAIGECALELVAAWYVQEFAGDDLQGNEALLRAASTADADLIDLLRTNFTEAVPRQALHGVNGKLLLPSLLGPICRQCGCSQNDACGFGCSWAEEDLCSSCTPESTSA